MLTTTLTGCFFISGIIKEVVHRKESDLLKPKYVYKRRAKKRLINKPIRAYWRVVLKKGNFDAWTS